MNVTEVASGVHLVEGHAVNWVLLSEGDAVTLVDAGYPGDHDDVVASLASLGRTVDDVQAVLVTHAHVDHIGSLPRLLEGRDTPVLTSVQEARHAHRDFLEQATPAQVARNAWRPRVLRWSLHVMRAGGTADISVPQAAGVEPATPLDLPGRPVPIVTPGHTSGHTMYHLPQHGVAISGDALVTGHAISGRTGPQLLDPMFHHDLEENRRSLRDLAGLDADLVLPGHGSAWRGRWFDAVDQAVSARKA